MCQQAGEALAHAQARAWYAVKQLNGLLGRMTSAIIVALTVLFSAEAVPSPAHLLQHLVAFVVCGDGCVDGGHLDARGLQRVISPLVDGQKEVTVCAKDLLLPLFSLHVSALRHC